MSPHEVRELLKSEIARETGLVIEQIDNSASFYSLGLDSISSVFVLDEIGKKLSLDLNPMLFWDYPTVELLANHIATLPRHD